MNNQHKKPVKNDLVLAIDTNSDRAIRLKLAYKKQSDKLRSIDRSQIRRAARAGFRADSVDRLASCTAT